MNKIGVILKINIKSAILIMNNFGAKNCTLLTIHIKWDNGSTLGAAYPEDRVTKI